MTDKICSCPGRGDGSLRWPCEAHPPNQNETKSNQRFCFTEAQVEAAAEALASREPMRSATEWENLHEFERSGFRESARAALEAATPERDAALAALERVRETLSLHNPNGRLVKEVLAALDGAPEPDREYHLTEVETKREMTNPVYVLRGGVYLLDEHAGVLIDSAGNFSAKTKGNPRSLAVLLKAIAESIEDDVAWLPVEGEQP